MNIHVAGPEGVSFSPPIWDGDGGCGVSLIVMLFVLAGWYRAGAI